MSLTTEFAERQMPLRETFDDRIAEDAAAWAERLTESVRGLMKNEIAAHGGTTGYMAWVRSDDDGA